MRPLIRAIPILAVTAAFAAILWTEASVIDANATRAVVRGVTIAAIVGALVVAAWLFDSWIDSRRPVDRYDGDTAVWVMIGCTMVMIAWTAIMVMLYGWSRTVIPLAALFGCFVASGIVMYFGEVQRTRNQRNHGKDRRR